jgi:hypothetical protein
MKSAYSDCRCRSKQLLCRGSYESGLTESLIQAVHSIASYAVHEV